jgi:broad specificity phosphatase PhoE
LFVTATTFILARHAESQGVHHILVGRNQAVGLTASGRAQAETLAASLKHYPIGRIISSPQLRTRQTADAVAQVVQLPVECDSAFDEMDFGHWTGTSFAALDQFSEWKRYNQFRSMVQAPGGESLYEVQSRAVAQIAKIHAETVGKTVLIVTHADVIRAAISFFCGAPLDLFLRFQIDPASHSIVHLAESNVSVQCVNRI